MSQHEIIEGEFKVIAPSEIGSDASYVEPPPDGTWTFWLDDFPALGSIAVTFILAYLAKAFLL
ncbi:hypothetical protein [Phenylobacterium sp.]|uniref:hypothetical protein n=1 Tax=Phenylobacterium sp. TaxID=1871053 RepID=UPI003BA8F06E